MVRVHLLLLLCFFSTFQAQAKKIRGKIIYENDTIDVVFDIPAKMISQEPNYQVLQYKVKYFNEKGKKIVLKPEHAIEIQFTHHSKVIRMLSRPNTLGFGRSNSKVFLKLEVDGFLKLFSFFFTQGSPGTYSASTGVTGAYNYNLERYVLQKGNEELKKAKSLSFKKDMFAYLGDCPRLTDKIDNKDFKKDDIEFVVKFYNANCR